MLGMAAVSHESTGGVSRQDLINSVTKPDGKRNTAVGRAFQKHSNRPGSAFPGELSGNPVKNTEQGLGFIQGFLNHPEATWTTKTTKAFGDVLEVRLPSSQGARWTADGSKFIGFL